MKKEKLKLEDIKYSIIGEEKIKMEDIEPEDIIWVDKFDGWRLVEKVMVSAFGKYTFMFDTGESIRVDKRNKFVLM